MTTAHVFIATSLDGYIARADGALDWLPAGGAPGEDLGYEAFIADKDLIVMGRGTYEKVLGFDEWPYPLPVVVMSQQLADTQVPAALADRVRFSALTPRALLGDLSQRGVRRVYLDGGRLVQSFLREGLVTDLVITTIPVLLGGGRPLFGALPHDIRLTLVGSRSFAGSGMVQSTYRVRA